MSLIATKSPCVFLQCIAGPQKFLFTLRKSILCRLICASLFLVFGRCGPCLLMAPEFEEAAKELKNKVRFVKLDTDKEEAMAARLNIMGLPTLLFLDKYDPAEGEEVQEGAKAVLKGRIEGALRKDNIKDLCEFHFFDGPQPSL